MNRRQLSGGQKALVLIVVIGTVVISMIGFIGSYDAVLRLAQRNGFGWFSYLLPIGIDIGITVFLALDLLLTWMRIPLPLLRQLAWVLTGATIVFNAASAWPNPLASGMHGVVPLLFVAAIEAARHTVGRLAQIEANQLFERTRLGRWVFAPVATMRLFRRRVLWELRSYEEALEHERRRLVYRARLRAVYGRMWRYRAPVDLLLLLKLANLGEPLPEFRLDPPVLPATTPVALPGPTQEEVEQARQQASEAEATAPAVEAEPAVPPAETAAPALEGDAVTDPAEAAQPAEQQPAEAQQAEVQQAEQQPAEAQQAEQQPADAGQAAEQQPDQVAPAPAAAPETAAAPEAAVVPETAAAPEQRTAVPTEPAASIPVPTVPAPTTVAAPTAVDRPRSALPAQGAAVDRYRTAFVDYTQRHGDFPDGEQLAKWLFEQYGVTGRTGDTLSPRHLRRYLPGFREEWEAAEQAAIAAP